MKTNFDVVISEIEDLDKSYSLTDILDKYKNIWRRKEEIRLWSVGKQTARLLEIITIVRKPKVILELGTSAGYSTLWMARSPENNNQGSIYTIELMDEKIKLAKDFFERSGLSHRIIQIEGEIDEVLDNWDKKVDQVFIDADKGKYLDHFKKVEPHLSDRAVIMADNAVNFRDYMKDYIDYMSSSPEYISEIVDLDNKGIMISIKK